MKYLIERQLGGAMVLTEDPEEILGDPYLEVDDTFEIPAWKFPRINWEDKTVTFIDVPKPVEHSESQSPLESVISGAINHV